MADILYPAQGNFTFGVIIIQGFCGVLVHYTVKEFKKAIFQALLRPRQRWLHLRLPLFRKYHSRILRR